MGMSPDRLIGIHTMRVGFDFMKVLLGHRVEPAIRYEVPTERDSATATVVWLTETVPFRS